MNMWVIYKKLKLNISRLHLNKYLNKNNFHLTIKIPDVVKFLVNIEKFYPKNKFLITSLEKILKNKMKLIDSLGIYGDFLESQAFAFLAIRSYLGKPISFPETTGCFKASTGGEIVKIT